MKKMSEQLSVAKDIEALALINIQYFDGKAYPCSMCIRGEERTDKFEPKGRHTKQTERSE